MVLASVIATVALLVPARHVAPRMGWTSPNWNWGSAIGDAHDEAMRVRAALSTPEARRDFLQATASEDGDIEAAKMALALSCQRARNLGYDLQGRPWENLMESMAACEYEGEDGLDKLAAAIRDILPPMSQYPGQPPRVMISVALQALDFVPRGL